MKTSTWVTGLLMLCIGVIIGTMVKHPKQANQLAVATIRSLL
jgi:uncharacterized membrane-anchored protein YhcB (DUF1043 family)